MSAIRISPWEQLAPKYAELLALYTYANATNALSVVPGPFGSVPEGTRAGNRAILANVSTYLSRLAVTGDLGQGVFSGAVTPERWYRVANAQGESLNAVLQLLDDESGRFWKEVVVQTGSDVATIVKDGANGASGAGIGVGIVVALIIALKVLR